MAKITYISNADLFNNKPPSYYLRGAGTQGTQGTQGIQGISGGGGGGGQGIQGIQGITGSQGAQGTQGIQGRQGIQGASGSGSMTDASFGAGLHWVTGVLEASLGDTMTFTNGAIDSSIWDVSLGTATVYLKDPSHNLELSYIEMTENGGELLFVDMPFSSAPIGVEESYTMRIDGSNALKIYGVSASDALSEIGVVVEANYLCFGSPQTNGSWRFLIDASELQTEKRIAGSWIQISRTSTKQILTDAEPVFWNMNISSTAQVTLGASRSLDVSNAISGDNGTLIVIQGGSGSYTLTLPSGSLTQGGEYSLSTAVASKDILSFFYDGSNYFWNVGKAYA